MSVGSGLGGSVGVAPETTYGVYPGAPTNFPEVTKCEVKKTKTTVQGGGLAAGRPSALASRRVQIAEAGTGSIDLEVTNKGYGLWLLHALGAGTIAQQGATAAWLQSFTVADNIGKSLTVQNGVPDTTGVARPYTGKGGKVTKLSFACTTTSLLTSTVELDFQKVSEAETLAAPSYTTAATAFHGGQMRVRMGTFGAEAAVIGVKGFSMDLERPQAVDRNYASAAGAPLVKAEPIWNDWFKVSGSFDVDLVNKADFVDRFAADANTSVVVEFVGNLIAGSNFETFRITVPAAFFEDATPTLQGTDVTGVSIPFTGTFDLTNGLVKIDYVSTDTTIAA